MDGDNGSNELEGKPGGSKKPTFRWMNAKFNLNVDLKR
jgi:hypothetical protein